MRSNPLEGGKGSGCTISQHSRAGAQRGGQGAEQKPRPTQAQLLQMCPPPPSTSLQWLCTGQEKGCSGKEKPGTQSARGLSGREAQGGHWAAAALLWGDLQDSPADWTDWGSSCQLKMLLPLLASVRTVRMRWELEGAGASPRNRTCPRTTTEPFLEGQETVGSTPTAFVQVGLSRNSDRDPSG